MFPLAGARRAVRQVLEQVELGHDPDRSTAADDDEFFSVGLQFKNGVIFNPEDAWGVGYAQTELGIGDEEDLLEGYYNLRMTQKMQLSFHLTHVTEKPLGADKVSYLVPGVRLQASF